MPNWMSIAPMPWDRRRSGDSYRKLVFCGEVSTFYHSVAVSFLSFDAFSPYLLPIWYINRFRIRCGSRQYFWIGVGPATQSVSQFFLERWVFLSLCWRHFSIFRCLLTISPACLIHQSIPQSMWIATMRLDGRRSGDSSRNAIFLERWVFLSLCCCHLLLFRCLLIHWCTCIIHQSIRNSMRFEIVPLHFYLDSF